MGKKKEAVSVETGEVVQLETKRFEQYVMVFAPMSEAVYRSFGSSEGLSMNSLSVALCLAAHAGMNTGLVGVNGHSVAKMGGLMGMGAYSFRMAVYRLAKLGIVQKVQNGVYRLNPEYLWRGSMYSRHKAIKEGVKRKA